MEEIINSENQIQLCGFTIGKGSYAIPVLEVQEVVRPQKLTPVPLAPSYVDGLINLRGQIVTAINLRKLFYLEDKEDQNDYMNIIVRSDDENLYALVVDEIMDVIDVEQSTFEVTPDTLDDKIQDYLKGVYKLDKMLLTLLNLDKILNIETTGE
jgi:purine-binding chemotaxis protein CheW